MAKTDRHFGALETALGWKFTTLSLLEQAVIHTSARERLSNERLEFLGDRVLGLVIAEALLEAFPDEEEGALAPRLNALVRKETCAEIARDISLGQYLKLARSESLSGGRRKTAMLGDAMEAVLAAVYLDGGIDAAEAVIKKHWAPRLSALSVAPIDPKTALQEWAQARGMSLPQYRITDRTGPDHAPQFTVMVSLSDGRIAEATAASKRFAERDAADALMKQLALSKGDKR